MCIYAELFRNYVQKKYSMLFSNGKQLINARLLVRFLPINCQYILALGNINFLRCVVKPLG